MAIAGLQGNEMAQPRVFAHDAVSLGTGSATQIAGTESRGCCLYVGTGGNIEVIMEGSSTSITFANVPNGTFMPILVTHYISGGSGVLALF
jgi:hypothetical protein